MPEMSPNLAEIEGRIAVLRENIRELVEQAAAFSGAADEELVSFGLRRLTYGDYARWAAKNFAIGIIKFASNSGAHDAD